MIKQGVSSAASDVYKRQIHICTEDLDRIAISINNWWKKRYPNYKIRVVSKNEFERIKNATELPHQ